MRALLLLVFVVLSVLSCRRGDTVCACSHASRAPHSYSLGRTDNDPATIARCSDIQLKDGWDTCVVVEPK